MTTIATTADAANALRDAAAALRALRDAMIAARQSEGALDALLVARVDAADSLGVVRAIAVALVTSPESSADVVAASNRIANGVARVIRWVDNGLVAPRELWNIAVGCEHEAGWYSARAAEGMAVA